MLLQHAWLAPLIKPETIMEEDEEAAEAAAEAEANGEAPPPTAANGGGGGEGEEVNGGFVDREVGEWLLNALDRRRRGVLGTSVKPALHTAPLDARGGVGSPNAGVKPVAV